MLVVAFNFKESESNKKTLKEWYCHVDFMSPGQFMLVESESNKKTQK